MNILTMGGLPEEYEGIPISPDFRNMIQVDLILNDSELSGLEKTFAALDQLYPEIPEDIDKAVAGLEWFFRREEIGKREGVEEGEGRGRGEMRAFDFDQDASLIYAAFYSTYGISLTTIDFLHWWEFMALFEGLPETTLIQRVIHYRTADLNNMSKEERKHFLKMRKLFALKEPDRQPLSAEELTRQTKDRVKRRFEEASLAVKES